MNLPNYGYPDVRPLARMTGSPRITGGAARFQFGSHANRQSRFEARSRRRYGDWSVLDIPTVLLWMDDDDTPDPENECQC
jgi:hypothetical protein